MDTELIERRNPKIENEASRAELARQQAEIGRQVFKKLCARLAELDLHPEPRPVHSKAVADVIVTPNGPDFFFEPQNWEATEWLYRRFGLTIRNAQVRDKIRVQAPERRGIIAELKAAGFAVLY